MKCTQCAAEVPVHAQFCMRCGAPAPGTQAAVARPAVAPARSGPRRGVVLGAAAAVLLIGGLLFGLSRLRGGQVVTKSGDPGAGGPLTEAGGRIANPGPLTTRPGVVVPEAPPPQDVIDYLKFLKGVERQRVVLSKQQLGRLLSLSGGLTTLGADTAAATGEPEPGARRAIGEFQAAMQEWAGQWQQLSQYFLSKTPPQSCADLAGKYYDLLGKTAGAMARVGSSFSQAMSGDPGPALDTLTGMQGSGLGSASKDVADACTAADDSLASVCDRFKLHKDFDIKDEGGGGNLLGR